jgi:hypothetical protein
MLINTDPPDNVAIRELRDSLKNLSASLDRSGKKTERLTVAMFFVALFQLVIGALQFVITFAYSDDLQLKIFGVVMTIITTGVFAFISRLMFKKD